jgi:amidase
MIARTRAGIFSSVTELQNRMKKKEVSPVEVVGAYLDQIHDQNKSLNAYTHVLWEQAMQSAEESEKRILHGHARTLEGIPLAIKDNMSVAGVPTSGGSRMYPVTPAQKDGHMVRKLREAGVIFLGKTNLPEFATLPVTENERFGATRNPWNLDCTPGGSSGGSAAAVASGMAPAAHGNDGGGSLRIPASACGLFSMKPSRGRISYAPYLGDAIGGLAVQGFLTHSVLDNALLLDVTRGFVPGDPYSAPEPARPYTEEVKRIGKRLRIGWTVTPPFLVGVHPSCILAVHKMASLLTELGHDVEPCTPPGWQDPELWPLFMNIWAAGISWGMQLDILQGRNPEYAESHNRALWQQGLRLSAADYLVTVTKLQQYTRRIMAAFEDFDVLLTPTLAEPPVRIGEMFEYAGGDADLLMERGGQFTPFTSVVNVTGQPAMQVPFLVENGLPIGVQFIGRQNDESTLFQLGAQIESHHAFVNLVPPED